MSTATTKPKFFRPIMNSVRDSTVATLGTVEETAKGAQTLAKTGKLMAIELLWETSLDTAVAVEATQVALESMNQKTQDIHAGFMA